jgi:hypothetical protein
MPTKLGDSHGRTLLYLSPDVLQTTTTAFIDIYIIYIYTRAGRKGGVAPSDFGLERGSVCVDVLEL